MIRREARCGELCASCVDEFVGWIASGVGPGARVETPEELSSYWEWWTSQLA